MRVVSWNVNGLFTTLKDAVHRHSSASNYFQQVLKADIVCFQEAKVQEEKLVKWIACIDGYESFWAFSKVKKGYSGVVTYVKEGLSPLDARADWFGDEDPGQEWKEGRMMYTDHGTFVLLNVYVPNAGERQEGRPRLSFKLAFLEALEHLCDKIVSLGRHIIVVGDFNIPHKQKDVHKRWNIEDIYSSEEIAWIDCFLHKYVDLFRHFHPDSEDVYTVWDTKTSGRLHNEGQRIDYAVCNPEFLMHVKDTQIETMIPKQLSDHDAVVITLLDQPLLPVHPAPAISSRNMRQFQDDHRQRKLTTLLSGRSLKEKGTDHACIQSKKGDGGIASISNQEEFPINLSNGVATGSVGVKHKSSPDTSEIHSRVTKQKSLKSFFRGNSPE